MRSQPAPANLSLSAANATRGSLNADWAYTIAVVLVALLPRLFVAIAWAREPVWDGHYYHFGAMRIAEGLGYSEDVVIDGSSVRKPWSHYPVGYSGLLGVLYLVFGPSLLVAPIANAVVGAAQAALTHRLGRYFLSQNRARVAAAIVALHPGLIAYSAVLMTEPLTALLVTAAALAALRWTLEWRGVILAGLFVGLATLVRPSALLAAPLLALMIPVRDIPRALGRGLIATGIALVVVTPWTVRNCVVMDGCAFVSTNGGWNLAIGALTETGRFHTLRASDGCRVVTGQVQQDRCWGQVGRKVILDDPLRWLSLMPKKLAHTYNHESFAVEYLHEAAPRSWPEARRSAGRELLTAFHLLVLLAAALGIVSLPNPRRLERRAFAVQLGLLLAILCFSAYAAESDSHPFYVLAVALPVIALVPLPGAPTMGPVGRYLLGLLFVTSITHAVFFGDDRYHLVVTPALCLLAAAALRLPSREIRRRETRTVA